MCFDIINVFQFIINVFKNYSDMCETKAIVVSISLILLVASSFCIYQAHTENKVGQYRDINIENPCEKEYKKYWMNEGECYYLVDEDFVACNCTWLYGG